MNLSCLRSTVAAFALVAGCATPERITIVDDPMPLDVPAGVRPYVVRVVDDLSGEPIAGADLLLVRERMTPLAGESWFEARASSDADGFVRIAEPPPWHLQVLRLPAGGVVASSDFAPVWRVGRTFDVPVVVQGPDGGAPRCRSLVVDAVVSAKTETLQLVLPAR